ncbi:MAG: helix-turn-helix domain-containing protein [Thioalkalivibrio sp.]|nr:helix-turn-helix domain-containing protein [Thioalkalivibrio sp.]
MNDTLTSKEIAALAGVRPVTVRQWRTRHGDFPAAVAEYGGTLVFDRAQVTRWLLSHHKIDEVPA